MCGIAGIHSLSGRPIDRCGVLADYLLLNIESRGRDATGFIAVGADGSKTLDKYPVPARQFIRGREKFPMPRTVLLHTRWATRGNAADPRNAHPQVSGTTAAVHNGTIYNADELFSAFKLPRRAQVDSEIIPALVQHAGWEQAQHALSLMEGGAATAIVDVTRPGELILARVRDYPLVWTKVKDLVIFASTESAIRNAYKSTYGRQLRSKINTMVPGELLRINGKVETTAGIPGVFGVETDAPKWPRSSGAIRSAARPAGPAVSKAARKRAKKYAAAHPVTVALDKAKNEREEQLRIQAIRRGTQASHSEVIALIEALEQARAERDEADMILDELTGSELDWTDRGRFDYAPGRWS